MVTSPKRPKTNRVPPSRPDDEILKTIQQLMSGALDDDLFGSSPEELIDELLEREDGKDEAATEIVMELVAELSDLQVEANSANREARRAREELRAWIAKRIEAKGVSATHLAMLGQAFSQSGFDPGPTFEIVLRQRMESEVSDELPEVDLDEMLDDLASQIGEDPVALYEAISHYTRFMSKDRKWAAAIGLADSGRAVLQEAALGFLLTGDDKAVDIVCDSLIASQAAPSGRLLDRLVRVRGLIVPARYERVDAAIETLRGRAQAFEPEPVLKLAALFTSSPDGAGAQAVAAQLGQGRNGLSVSLLFKFGRGIVDVGILEGMSKRDLSAMFDRSGMDRIAVTVDFVVRRLSAALAENHASGTPVPFSLLRVMELLGIDGLRPDPLQPEAVFDSLIGQTLLDASSPQTVQVAFETIQEAGISETWFESSEEIDALLRKVRPRKQRVAALLTQYLPGRRQFWIEQCAWSALVLSEKAAKKKQLGTWVAVLGKQLYAGRPLAESPLMQAVAEGTIESFMYQ